MPDNGIDTLNAEIDAALAAEAAQSEQPDSTSTDSEVQTDQPEVEADTTTEVSETEDAPTSEGDEPSFKVKVRGEEMDVTLDELLKGYQRQADYTRSKQEVAAERQEAAAALELLAALQNDPQGTLQILEQQLGFDADTEEIDPIAQRLNQTEQFIAQQQEQAAIAQIEAEVSRVAQTYGAENVDAEALLDYAIEQQIPDLEAAFLKMQAAAQREAQIADQNRKAAERKRSTPPVAGRSTAAGTQAKPPRSIKTVADALNAALEDHGVDSWGQIDFGTPAP